MRVIKCRKGISEIIDRLIDNLIRKSSVYWVLVGLDLTSKFCMIEWVGGRMGRWVGAGVLRVC